MLADFDRFWHAPYNVEQYVVILSILDLQTHSRREIAALRSQ